MKLDLDSAISERRGIISSFRAPLERTALIATDITDHRHWLEDVYRKTLIHEACVFDDCIRRFEREFGRWRMQ